MPQILIYLIIASLAFSGGFLAGVVYNRIKTMHHMGDAVDSLLQRIDMMNAKLDQEMAVMEEEKINWPETHPKYREKKKPILFPEEDERVMEEAVRETLYKNYSKEVIQQFENLSDEDKKLVIEDFKKLNNGDSQSISSEAG